MALLNSFQIFFSRLTVSTVVLIAANLLPLYGVFSLGWQVFPLLLIFWLENVIIGFFNVIRMILVYPYNLPKLLAKLFMVPFFCFHYGAFILVHGIFVFGFFGGFFNEGAAIPGMAALLRAVSEYSLVWVITGLICSHLFSFIYNFILKGEYRQANLAKLMEQPYSRVIVLHLTILGMGFITAMLNSPLPGLLLMVALKIILDVRAHIREHSGGGSGASAQEK